MAMPKGDSLQKVNEYYHYLQAHQLTPHGRTETWHVDWTALAWLWGFVVVLSIVLLLSGSATTAARTRRRASAPLDRFGGYTTEAAGRVPFFFWVVTLVIVAFGAEFVIGHLISGQLF